MMRSLAARAKQLAKHHAGPMLAARQPRRVDLPPTTWGLAVGPNGTLWSGELDLADAARRLGTPLHLVLGDALDHNATTAIGDDPNVADVFYSYKTNPVPAVLRRLHDHGVGAEVISPYELWLALRLGVQPERIIYNGPAKSDASLRVAIEHDVLLVNANSATEARRIGGIAAETRRQVNLGLRVALPSGWAGQFGISHASPQLLETVRWALREPSVRLYALHAHRGLTMRYEAELTQHVAELLAVCDEIREATGWHPDILDIGGSLACPTTTSIPNVQHRLNRALGTDLLPPVPATSLSIAEARDLAVRLVRERFAPSGLPTPKIVLEPGRAMTANTQLLLTSVLDVKDDSTLPHAVLDAGINVAEPVAHEYHQLFHVDRPAAAAAQSYRLVGPICTPADVLYNNWRLPHLRPGDVLAIADSGAYFVPFSTAFSFGRAAVAIQDAATATTCRRAETFTDLVSLDEGIA